MLSRAENIKTSIRTDLRAIFVSLELSRTTWLVSSLSPGKREKMSKHSVPAGDIGGLLTRLRSHAAAAVTWRPMPDRQRGSRDRSLTALDGSRTLRALPPG
jgi:hypothetical protein